MQPNHRATDRPLKEQLMEHWQQALERAGELDAVEADPRTVVRGLSDTMDGLVQGIVADALTSFGRKYAGAEEPYAICAVGGYGRRELYPFSDIDLLFLHPYKPTPLVESVAESVLYTFWDLGFNVGHAIRSPAECIAFGKEDVTVRTNMLDIRFLAGDEGLFAAAVAELGQNLLHSQNRSFVEAKIREMEARRDRFGNTAYLLEPNVKEGPGGLRDLQTVYWVGKSAFRTDTYGDLHRLGLLDPEETEQLELSHHTLMRIRTALHLNAGKAQDRLTFAAQESIAARFGYRDQESELASEALMRSYYELSRETVQAVDLACEVCLDRLSTTSRTFWFRRKRALGDGFYSYRDRLHGTPQRLRERPSLMIQAFRLCQQHGLPLSFELKKVLKRNAHRLEGLAGEEASAAAAVFKEIVVDTRRIFKTFNDMNELGVLRALIPEFEHQYCRVQHDTYHIYTADVHLLFCLRAFAALRAGDYAVEEPDLTELAANLDDPLVGAMAVLLHDIGKGYGMDHSIKGAELATTICQRLELSPEQTRTVAALVREHLRMSHTAQRRDLSDSRVIREFAQTFQSADTIDQLLVLTFCDQMGVGPGVWTPWKRSLLLRLHNDAKRAHQREDIQGLYKNRIRSRKAKVKKALAERFSADVLDRFLRQMPPRFFLRHGVDAAEQVVAALAEGLETGCALSTFSYPDRGTYVVLSEPDRPGLFAFHAGLFRAVDMSIKDAEGYVLGPSDWVLNIFLVDPTDPLFFQQEDRVANFRDRLLRYMADQSEEIVRQTQKEAAAPPMRTRRRVRVRVDETLSTSFTVFEVFGWDRIGLLQDLAMVFFRHGLTIGLARIHTEGQRVSDVFYVQDAAGSKVNSRERLEAIQAELLEAARA